MDGYYKIIILIAIVVYIILMTIVAVLMSRSSTMSFPPQQSSCPDYWMMGSGKSCMIPNQGAQNVGNLYSTGTLVVPAKTPGNIGANIDFGDGGWTTIDKTKTTLCNQRNWANTNGILWGGVTNSNTC